MSSNTRTPSARSARLDRRATAARTSTSAEHIALVASAEQASEHPLARAVVTYAAEKTVELSGRTAETQAARGRGIAADVGGRRVLFGNQALLATERIAIPEQASVRAEELRATGATASLVAVDGAYAETWAVGDTIKPSAREALEGLRSLGISRAHAVG